MNHLPTGLRTKLATSVATLTLLAGAVLLAVVPAATAGDAAPPIKFGMSANAVSAQSAQGVKPDYGTFWIGPWTLKSGGWGTPDTQLTNLKNAGVTPAVHFYYWGDDISPSCVEYGCWSSLHNAHKDRAGWNTLATQMTDHLNAKMGGKPVVIFLESEFNKGGIETYEPFDGYLAAMAKKIHAAYPNAIIVLGFGNWGSVHWGTFDRAAAASDMVGVQSMRGSTRQSKTDMYTLYDSLLSGVKTLGAKFPGKAIMITDIAVSSYPEPEYLSVQRDVIKEVFDHLGTLKALGVKAIIYRSWLDTPTMDLANWYGMAERYWGLANSNGLKPSAYVWINGVKAERAGSTPMPTSTTTTTSTSTTAYSATFTLQSASNEWWVQEKVVSSPAAAKVELRVNGGAWQAMKHESYGDWTLSKYVAKGSKVEFRATAPDGQTALSAPQSYLGATPTSSTSTSTAVSKTYTATFTLQSASNEWWVQEKVASSPAPAKVELRVNGGSWQAMKHESYGDWTLSKYVAKGSKVEFRATAPDGQTALSAPLAYLGSATTTTTATSTAFKATFSPKSVGNDWWVEAAVSANKGIAKVEANAGAGWVKLDKQDWGTYAKSVHVADGAKVTFRAYSSTGEVSYSQAVVWT